MNNKKLKIIENIIEVEKLTKCLNAYCLPCFSTTRDINKLAEAKADLDNIKQIYNILLFKYKLVDLSFFILKKDLKEFKVEQNSNKEFLELQISKIHKLKRELLCVLTYLNLNEFETSYLKQLL